MITNFVLLALAALFALVVLFPVIKFAFKFVGALVAVSIGLIFMGSVGYALFF